MIATIVIAVCAAALGAAFPVTAFGAPFFLFGQGVWVWVLLEHVYCGYS